MTKLHLRVPKPHKHKCGGCDASFPNQSLLMVPQATHATLKSFQCNLCDKGYPSDWALCRHVYRVHPKKKKHACRICEQRFQHKYELGRHTAKHFEELKHILYGKTYTRKHSLKSHMASHSEPKSFTCPVCGTGFFTEHKLKEHISRRHAVSTSEKNFCCKICGKAFKHVRWLREHEGTHCDDISPKFECDKCEKKFRSQRYLREQMNNIHGPEDKRRER